jgi:MarR family transcriptional regulator, temperature-dependent positive regulator of motility
VNLETRFQLLRELEANPDLSQRALAQKMGLSLGKTHYCLKALIDKGWVKAGNFKNSNAKHRYFYILTPAGITAKAKLTRRFLKRKMAEHDQIVKEIEQIRQELEKTQKPT